MPRGVYSRNPTRPAKRASNGFSADEVMLMASLLETLLRSGSPRHLVKHREFGRMAGKFSRMRVAARSRKPKRAA